MDDWLMLYGLGLVAVLLVTVVMPWVNFARTNALRAEVVALRIRVRDLVERLEVQGVDLRPVSRPDTEPEAADHEEVPSEPAPEAPSAPPPPDQVPQKRRTKFNWEQQFGARLPVWIGGLALALAGFFLVKYSIDHNLLSPAVRVVLGGVLGFGLLGAGHWVRARPNLANGRRIAQALSGAGVAVLYLALYAATSLYALIPESLGFAGLAVTTAGALALSLRHGAPIALLGLMGGFATPLLLDAQAPSAPLLFLYLYLVFAGLMIVIRQRNWWLLSLPTLMGAFLWVGYWMFTYGADGDGLWLGLFLLAVSATIVVGNRPKARASSWRLRDLLAPAALLNYLGLAGAIGLMGLVAADAGFGTLEWGLFGLLAAGGVALAAFDERRYGFVPWAAMAVCAVMLYAWPSATATSFAVTLIAFAGLFMVSGSALLWRARWPALWGGLVAASALGYFALAYLELSGHPSLTHFNLFWGGAATVLAVCFVHLLQRVVTRFPDGFHKEALLAIFSVAAITFVTLTFMLELDREILSVAVAAETLAVAWVNTRVAIRALRAITLVLAMLFGALLVPQILLLVQLTAYSLVEAKLNLQEAVPIVAWPLFQLGLPAALLLGASWLLRRQKDDALVRGLELAVVGLIAVMGYYLTRHAFHIEQDVLFVRASFVERGVVTNILYLYGLACLWSGRRLDRVALFWSGIVLCGVALFRIAYFDLITLNPLWAHQEVGSWPILNGLLLPFGAPLAWTWLAARELAKSGKENWAKGAGAVQLLLVFALITLNIRQLYHGSVLDLGTAGSAEIYSYSLAWLVLGIGLLIAGIATGAGLLRFASLGIMVLTVGKVFLYDAAELEGLYRVVSFFGLGLSLLGLSYFYARFVFGPRQAPAKPD